MNNEEWAGFAQRLEAGIGPEPPVGDPRDDLRRGKRRLRRRRARMTGFSAVAVVAIAGVALTVTPRLGQHDAALLPAGPSGLSDAQIVRGCLSARNVSDSTFGETPSTHRVRAEMAGAVVMSSASNGFETIATLRSGDGAKFADCHLGNGTSQAYGTHVEIYPTAVKVASHRRGGQRVYTPPSENGPGTGTAAQSEPTVWLPCTTEKREETAAYYRELAACPRFTITWNDRRVPDVARARIVAPDGHVGWADVRDGYLSYAYEGTMTPQIAEQIRSYDPRAGTGEWPGAREVTFYDKHGHVLVTDRHLDGRRGTLTIENYPSLAMWTDRR